jgi:hypothetical protein
MQIALSLLQTLHRQNPANALTCTKNLAYWALLPLLSHTMYSTVLFPPPA